MKKQILFIFILMIVFIAACQQAVKKETAQKTPAEAPKTAATGDAAVDAVGKDINNVNSVEKDLGTDQLGDLDSGLADVQKI